MGDRNDGNQGVAQPVEQTANPGRAEEPRPQSQRRGEPDGSEGVVQQGGVGGGAQFPEPAGGIPGQQQPDNQGQGTPPSDGSHSHDGKRTVARQRSLSPEERTKLAHAVGAYGDAEQAQGRPIHPRHWWWPPRGMADGLYKDVVEDRAMWFCFFHACSSVRWALVVSHILVSATIAALGQGSSDGASGRKVSHMTALAAANAVIAGLLALLHNSGLPDRYRNNKAEFEMVEDHIRRLLDSGLAPEDQTIGQVICDCFDRFADAKAAVMASLPATYNSKRRLRPQPLYLGSQPSVGL